MTKRELSEAEKQELTQAIEESQSIISYLEHQQVELRKARAGDEDAFGDIGSAEFEAHQVHDLYQIMFEEEDEVTPAIERQLE